MNISTRLLAYEPLTEQGLYARDFIDDLTTSHEAYTHTISAVGGFDTASFTLKGDETYLRDWFDDGLSRRVVYLNPEGIVVWEGYVNRLALTLGTSQKTRSLENLYNRVYLQYTPLDVSYSPPLAADEPRTIIVDELDSQSKWGVKAIVQKGGEDTDAGAYAWARTILGVHADPMPGENINTTSTSPPSLKIDCLGYFHALTWLPYISVTTGELQAHQAIQEILTYFDTINPSWISLDFGWMDYNFRTERRSANELRTCWEVIESIISRGGEGGERWVGGFYQGRRFIFKPAEDFQGLYADEMRLIRSLKDNTQKVLEEGLDTEVKPWDMVPDRIIRTVDL